MKSVITFILFWTFVLNISAQTVEPLDTQTVERFNTESLGIISIEIEQEEAKLRQTLLQLQKDAKETDKLRELLTKANKARFRTSITNLEKRYNAGQDIIHHIIKETNSFNSSFSLLVLQTQFTELIDPTTYNTFNSSMNSTLQILSDKKPFPKIDNINNLKSEIPGLNSPLITTGLSIASFFLAKFHRKNKLKAENFKSLTCVLSFTNQTKKDYDIIVSRLLYLSKRLNNFNEASKIFFTNYLTEIGFLDGYSENFPDAEERVQQIKSTFFSNILKEEEEISFIHYESKNDDKITYQIEQVKFLMNEYELILLEIDGYIKSYEEFIKKVKENSISLCTGLNSDTSRLLEVIENQLSKVQRNFQTVYKENRISPLTKRTLFGFHRN